MRGVCIGIGIDMVQEHSLTTNCSKTCITLSLSLFASNEQ